MLIMAVRGTRWTVLMVELSPPTDIERAVAVLALRHESVDAATAAHLIRQARSDDQKTLAALLSATVREEVILRGVAKALGIRFYDMYATTSEFAFDEQVFEQADGNFLRRFSALPLVDKQGRVVIAVCNPGDVEMIDYLRSRYRNFSLVLSPRSQVQNKLAYYASADLALPSLQNLPAAPSTPSGPTIAAAAVQKSPMQEWLDAVLNRAVSEGASDVHFLFNADKTLLLRFRVDGVLRPQRVPPQIRPIEAAGAILSRCETMDSANFREPQDGTFSFEAAGRPVDARVAMLPQSYGPTIVIRLLDSLNIRSRLDDMGFSPAHLQLMRTAIKSSQGTVLAVGPTGSGKSTTLYALLREINAAEKNVLTVENPVEYRLPMIGQTEIREGLGDRSLTFARALRSILRLDPDVILVGEIRDEETAEVAMQAAITGHLVLSSLHASSALGSYPRLSNMGLPPYLASEALSLIVSQRLLRRLHECAQPGAPAKEDVFALERLGLAVPDRVRHPVGCGGCNNSGYRGRIAAVELLVPSQEFRALATMGATSAALREQAEKDGFASIQLDGLRHVREGRTSVTEMARVLSLEDRGA